MWKRILKTETGQTAIEYLLLVVVAIGLGTTFYKKMKEYLLTSPNSVIGKNLNSLAAKLNQSPGYKRFRVPK